MFSKFIISLVRYILDCVRLKRRHEPLAGCPSEHAKRRGGEGCGCAHASGGRWTVGDHGAGERVNPLPVRSSATVPARGDYATQEDPTPNRALMLLNEAAPSPPAGPSASLTGQATSSTCGSGRPIAPQSQVSRHASRAQGNTLVLIAA